MVKIFGNYFMCACNVFNVHSNDALGSSLAHTVLLFKVFEFSLAFLSFSLYLCLSYTIGVSAFCSTQQKPKRSVGLAFSLVFFIWFELLSLLYILRCNSFVRSISSAKFNACMPLYHLFIYIVTLSLVLFLHSFCFPLSLFLSRATKKSCIRKRQQH